VFDAAGGFAPTIGILGAVLGLIQVMQHLQDINEVGKGIAVAFVATIYGVASANLLFLPWAGKLRIRLRERQVIQEMTLEAVLSIIEGVNPRALQLQLNSFLATPSRRGPRGLPFNEKEKQATRRSRRIMTDGWSLTRISLLCCFRSL
jgi:chemotaxis protein MotA